MAVSLKRIEHAPPPPAIAEFAVANLIKMGFPQRAAEGVISICSCHKEAKVVEATLAQDAKHAYVTCLQNAKYVD
ncbi:UNVERIFIED_CONTAM: General transcription factor IIH subunit [Sesamum angustifolium]|uniref:General transcription factor IIH subunit n=1 Tax=Sesamum angustifolium TaxID=2727405 RepID=A0AAW2QPD2_9LAMI